jgi:uncharacterized protein YceH (UPF0502 family)
MEEAQPPEESESELPQLDFEQCRVLGSLIEKELTTPEYYPMTLNALLNACNQKNNRSPRVNFSEEQVSQAIDQLRIKGLAFRMDLVGSRVPKFKHHSEKTLDLIKPERAIIAELLNRGPQTGGQLRSRASRMFDFEGLSDVEETVTEMQDRDEPLVMDMDPAPGQKERRWRHTLAPPPAVEEIEGTTVYVPAPDPSIEKVESMETEFKELRDEVEALRYQIREMSDDFREFKKQFD